MVDQSGYLALTVAIIGWGASSPLIELGLRSGISPLFFLALRFLLASLLLTPYMLLRRPESLQLFKIPLVWAVGVSESLGLIFQYLGQQQQVPAGLAALLSLLFLLIVPFISPFLLGETLQRRHLLAVLIGLLGVVIIAADGDLAGLISGRVSLLGVVLLLLAAVGYAFYIVFTSKLQQSDKAVDTFSLFYVVLVQVALSSLLSSLLLTDLDAPSDSVVLPMILLVIFSTLIAFVTYFEAMKTVRANVASVLLLAQVLVAFIMEYLFLDASYSLWIYLGGGIILLSMVVAVTTKSPQD